MRIGGLASGIDTDSIIKDLMAAQRIPLNKLNQKKQLLEWKRDDYRALNNKILEFRNLAFDMKLQGGYLSKKASISQESIVSVAATSSANEGQYTIKINELAKTASLTSGDLAGAAGGSKTLDSLGLSSDTQITITGSKGSKTINIKQADSIDTLVATINAESTSTGVKVNYDANMDRMFFTSAESGESSQIRLELGNGDNIGSMLGISSNAEVSEGSVSFASKNTIIDNTLGGTETLTIGYDGQSYSFDITATTKIGELVDQINAEMRGSGVTVSLNDSGELSFHNDDSGKAIGFSESAGSGLINTLGVNALAVNTSAIVAKGSDAVVEFNGIEARYDSNTFSIAGMNFTAKQVSDTVVDIGVTQDVDAVFDRIKSFVEKYNTLLDDVNKELLEKRHRDFKPLTAEEREAMSEDEIKIWEEKARSGMLRNDGMLSNGISSMRFALTNSVADLPVGQIKSLSEIGISNANIAGKSISGSYSDRGKLYIDETKLKKALTEKPEEVMALFTQNGDTEGTDGIATRLYDQASQLFEQITEKAGTTTTHEEKYLMGKENKDINERIDRLKLRMIDLEDRYYKQFTAMEKYINQMNSQSAWLAQQFSS
ncbi:flagellar filament capping protein FliD [Paenibacillus sp. J5C_2022]|uniref:flagellar filament capping protein FliD n=1 Tax=Paenibacillus sp. J5C2022 TaxID=2977129 RepID=UPI0021D362AA|nr:flagellar filament capping protein FliD [Paenibacillus sp. J5C2022]MCU6708437.1 flagellar filament capping protein FliD [Paenibacillus sp. J5C2022]